MATAAMKQLYWNIKEVAKTSDPEEVAAKLAQGNWVAFAATTGIGGVKYFHLGRI